MIGERKLYNTMKTLSISTLEVHRVLEEIKIDISKRTLQSYFDNDFSTCKDDRIEEVVKQMIKSKQELLKKLKQKFTKL